jgi:hypothetical protein
MDFLVTRTSHLPGIDILEAIPGHLDGFKWA